MTWITNVYPDGYKPVPLPDINWSKALKEVKVATQAHYAALSPEPITVIEGWQLGYLRGNALKYIARAGKKDQSKEGTIKDLEKAISYLRREINTLNGKPEW